MGVSIETSFSIRSNKLSLFDLASDSQLVKLKSLLVNFLSAIAFLKLCLYVDTDHDHVRCSTGQEGTSAHSLHDPS